MVVYDSTAPEGTGEGVYMEGVAEGLAFEPDNTFVKKYKFIPERIWINDVVTDESGEYLHDIRIELNKEDLV